MAVTLQSLALTGGPAVHTRPWPYWPVWDEREERALLEMLHSGYWGAVDGSVVAAFEAAWAQFQDARYCVATVNGTIALELALRALRIGAGDEVIVPAYTFVATAAAVLLVGALPIFVDIDAGSYELDPAAVAAAVTPRTRAILPVHLAGSPPDMDGILVVARRHGLAVVEDAAQAHGAAWRGRRVGALGDLGTFSFQATKNLTAGEGGAIVTNDETLFQRVWSLHNVGRTLSADWRVSNWYQHDCLGINARLTEFQGAVLLAQLTCLDDQFAQRERAAAFLDQDLGAIDGIVPQTRDPRVTAHAHYFYLFRYTPAAFSNRPRKVFLKALRAEGVPCSGGYKTPLHQTPAMVAEVQALCARWGKASDPLAQMLPVTERATASEAVWLPQHLLLAGEGDLAEISQAIRKIQAAWGSSTAHSGE
ncbi:MAG: DegT/DnrJ/EryC1/StrS family aminotransferase [Chloroflexi bacterium]|nr:DegT/DnrJ/EryC1/StrS family aminotransferase [Chloroflexota bacterium]